MRKISARRISEPFFALATGVSLIISLFIIASCSGSGKRKTPQRADQREIFSMIAELAAENPIEVEPITSLPTTGEDKTFSLSLFVDQSQSMRGYIPSPDATDFYKDSNFVSLLRALGHQAELNRFQGAKSFGSGLPPGAPSTTLPRPVELMKPDQKDYNLLSNDYATLMAEIIRVKSSDRISLIMTDGVQSHENTSGGSLMGATASALKQWIATGGHVEILLTTAPFKGKYFSEELRAAGKDYTLNVSVANRPFVVFVLIPNVELLEEWESFKKRDRLKDIEFVTYRLPQSVERTAMPEAAPAIVDLSVEDSKALGLIPRPNKPYARLDNLVGDPPWNSHLHSALIFRDALSAANGKPVPKVPVFIDITPPKDSKGEFNMAEFAKFRPTLSVYEKIPDSVKPATQPTDTPAPPEAEENILDRALNHTPQEEKNSQAPTPIAKKWKQTASLDLRAEDLVPTPVTSPKAGNKQLRLCYMLPWDGKHDLLCVLRMEAAETPVEPPQFEIYSTTDDSTPDELSKVYNLATLMDQLAKNEVKTARPTGFVLHIRKAE